MFLLSGYRVLTQLYESANSLVYRALREQDNQPAILKVLKQDYPTPGELTRYRQEYDITRSLNQEGVIKAYGLEPYQNSLVMVVEDFGGKSLATLKQQHPSTLEDYLEIAIKITTALGEIHAADIIHKDINPANIVYNLQTQQLKIIDFGISTRLSRENPTLKNLNLLEGTLAYISPEQTGRMNRSLDYRTDFYSLGVTFYELLTGQLPFVSEDVLELVHCHIAKPPIPPHQLVGAHRRAPIPKAISNIVMKLMAKTAEERYQSALGLKADLEECLKQLRSSGQISHFPLGTQEVCDRLLIPQKLYGREREVEALLQAFERVTTGQSEFLLVAGYSGIGKSSLVQEIYKPITAKQGYFISGKFDQYQRNIPYSAIIQAFKELSQQLLTETDAQLAEWKEKILSAVGTNGRVIIEIIPEVELIIEPQPPLLDLAPAEAQKRFNFVFQDFIKVFTHPANPLAIFLDDLQWADGASLKLIELLLTSSDVGLLLIGAYRDNEVNAAHPLRLSLENLQKEGVKIQEILLNSLELGTVNRWLADTLKASQETTQNLAELIQVKTGGNPFFITEFLQALYTENLLNCDYEQKRCIWDLNQVQKRNFTDNVVELMVAKIQKVPPKTQEVLKLAACIGNQFELETLAVIWKTSERETALTLQEAVAEGLIQPLGDEYKTVLLEALENKPLAKVELTPLNPPVSGGRNLTPSPLRGGLGRGSSYFGNRCDEKNKAGQLKVEYQFSHDRIQQAAYSLIPDELKQRVNLQIGQLLLQNTPESQIQEKIFDIVNQLNHGSELVNNQQQVYLENNLTVGAFTPQRIEIVNVLSSQAAISIENAKLYTEVRQNESRLLQLNQAFERFVPSEFLRFLNKQSIVDVQLGDQIEQEMSVLFSDIRDFTTLSEQMNLEDNFRFINSYLSRISPVIREHQGFIDKYIGDAIMALFSGGADNAVKAGIAMLNKLLEYNQHRTNSGYKPIQIGIGINTGLLMLGTVGEPNRMDGTVISDAVNLASRTEGLTKNYGVSLLITDQTFKRLQNPTDYAIRRIDEVKVKGKSEYVTIYEVFHADPRELKAAKLATLPTFTEAISFYLHKDYAAAAERFAVCGQTCPKDTVVQIYLERCKGCLGQ